MNKYTSHVEAPQMPKETRVFSSSHIGKTGTLSDLLRYTREHASLSIEECAHQTDIKESYLLSIERSRYEELPGEMYTRGWVKKYALFLGLPITETMEMYERERVIRSKLSRQEGKNEHISKELPFWKLFTARRLIFIAVIVLIVSYILFVLYKSIAAPTIQFSEPLGDMKTSENSIIIRGKTESGAHVRINKQAINIDENGFFTQELHLEEGLQTILIEAKKKNSKTFSKEIHVVKTAPPELHTTTPTSTNDLTN